MYVRDFKIKNKSILFMGSDGEIMKSPYFRSILTNELKSLAPNITSTIIRKIYENREITLNNGVTVKIVVDEKNFDKFNYQQPIVTNSILDLLIKETSGL